MKLLRESLNQIRLGYVLDLDMPITTELYKRLMPWGEIRYTIAIYIQPRIKWWGWSRRDPPLCPWDEPLPF